MSVAIDALHVQRRLDVLLDAAAALTGKPRVIATAEAVGDEIVVTTPRRTFTGKRVGPILVWDTPTGTPGAWDVAWPLGLMGTDLEPLAASVLATGLDQGLDRPVTVTMTAREARLTAELLASFGDTGTFGLLDRTASHWGVAGASRRLDQPDAYADDQAGHVGSATAPTRAVASAVRHDDRGAHVIARDQIDALTAVLDSRPDEESR